MFVHDWDGYTCEYRHENCRPCHPYTSLEEWRERISCLPPFAMWQLSGDDCKLCGPCKSVVREDRSFPESHIGRRQIRDAILRAEVELHKWLKYPVVPTWQSRIVETTKSGTFRLPDKHIHEFGIPLRFFAGTYPVQLSNNYYGSCYDDFQIQISKSPTGIKYDYYNRLLAANPEDFRVCFSNEDIPRKRKNDPPQRWEVTPTEVTVTDREILITGRAWTIVKPELYEFANTREIDAADPANFVENLSVYLERIDINQGALALQPVSRNRKSCDCDEWTCPDCYEAIPISVCLEDAEKGIGRVNFEGSCGCKWEAVDRVLVNYMAGDCSRDWLPEIIALSAAYLKPDVCDCRIDCLSQFTEDLARSTSGREDKRMVTIDQLENPLGTLQGHKIAWDSISAHMSKNKVLTI